MRFRTRNAYHLRISANEVLLLYLYLDERHISWMTHSVLRTVIEDLRFLIRPKLDAERNTASAPGTHSGNANIGTVDVHQSEHYQFAYFLRKVGQHQVLVKNRHFTAVDKLNKMTKPKTSPTLSGGEQSMHTAPKDTSSRATDNQNTKKPTAKGKRKRKIAEAIHENEPQEESGSQPMPRRSTRIRKAMSYHLQDDIDSDSPSYGEDENDENEYFGSEEGTNMDEQAHHAQNRTESTIPTERMAPMIIKEEASEPALSNASLVNNAEVHDVDEPQSHFDSIDIEGQDEKPKPILTLTYQGYTISDCCLCVIVEPWPPLSTSPVLSSSPSLSRASSSLPPERSELGLSEEVVRSKTPLFLPDWDRGRSLTPGFPSLQSGTAQIGSTVVQDLSESPDMDGMMVFSQALRFVGDSFTNSTFDDEVDGSVLFGDADEKKEII